MNESKSLFKNKTFLMIFSLVVAIVGWFMAVTIISDEGSLTVTGVPVNINVQSSVLGRMGLDPIEGGETTVEAVVYGKRAVIGGVTVEDITVTASLAGVSGAGTYELELIAENDSGKDFEVLSISPAHMTVKFDRLVDKVIKVEYELGGEYEIPEGYLREDVQLEPEEITVTGPENDIAAISKIVARAEFSGPLEQTTSAEAGITVLDKNGEAVAVDAEQVSFSADTVKVTIPLLKTTELAVRFEYLNVPDNFPIDELKYTLSTDTVWAAGPTRTASSYSDVLVGYVDLRDIHPGNTSFIFDVKLPDGFLNTENVEYVQVDFQLEDYVEREFYVSNFTVLNVPVLYDLTVLAQQINVKLVGPEEVLDKLTAGDIVVEVDISDRSIKTGQYLTPVRVYLPGQSLAWAVGTYEAAIIVQER